MIVRPLDELLACRTLDRELLHVFVAGPGIGEGILVALPDEGWIAIDGCEVRGESCIGALLDKWKSDDERLELVA